MMNPEGYSSGSMRRGSAQGGQQGKGARRKGKRKESLLYKTELCTSWESGRTCAYGDKCLFAHGLEDMNPVPRHPKYKTERCRNYWLTGNCAYGDKCTFLHEERHQNPVPPPPPRPSGQRMELGQKNPKYKTKQCRDWEASGRCSYGDRCDFIHTGVDTLLGSSPGSVDHRQQPPPPAPTSHPSSGSYPMVLGQAPRGVAAAPHISPIAVPAVGQPGGGLSPPGDWRYGTSPPGASVNPVSPYMAPHASPQYHSQPAPFGVMQPPLPLPSPPATMAYLQGSQQSLSTGSPAAGVYPPPLPAAYPTPHPGASHPPAGYHPALYEQYRTDTLYPQYPSGPRPESLWQSQKRSTTASGTQSASRSASSAAIAGPAPPSQQQLAMQPQLHAAGAGVLPMNEEPTVEPELAAVTEADKTSMASSPNSAATPVGWPRSKSSLPVLSSSYWYGKMDDEDTSQPRSTSSAAEAAFQRELEEERGIAEPFPSYLRAQRSASDPYPRELQKARRRAFAVVGEQRQAGSRLRDSEGDVSDEVQVGSPAHASLSPGSPAHVSLSPASPASGRTRSLRRRKDAPTLAMISPPGQGEQHEKQEVGSFDATPSAYEAQVFENEVYGSPPPRSFGQDAPSQPLTAPAAASRDFDAELASYQGDVGATSPAGARSENDLEEETSAMASDVASIVLDDPNELQPRHARHSSLPSRPSWLQKGHQQERTPSAPDLGFFRRDEGEGLSPGMSFFAGRRTLHKTSISDGDITQTAEQLLLESYNNDNNSPEGKYAVFSGENPFSDRKETSSSSSSGGKSAPTTTFSSFMDIHRVSFLQGRGAVDMDAAELLQVATRRRGGSAETPPRPPHSRRRSSAGSSWSATSNRAVGRRSTILAEGLPTAFEYDSDQAW